MSEIAKAVTILVVDDDPGLGRLIKRELSHEGYQAGVAASGHEAMAWLATQHADLLLLDLKLPDVSAEDFIRRLAEAGHMVPFVIITGQGDERVAVDMMKRGALDYLVKDRNFMDLVPVVVNRALAQVERMRRADAAEKRTKEIGEQMAAIVGSAMDAIISVDEDQNVVLFNRAAEKLFLCTAADAIGRPIERFLPAKFREAHRAHIKRFGETGETTRMMGRLGDVTGVRADGEEFPVEASISQVQVDGGKLFTVILRDISSRMQKDSALRQQAELLQLSHDAIIVWRMGAGIEFWNAGASKLYGHPPEGARGSDLHELLLTRYPCPWEEVERALRDEGAWEGEVRQTTGSGIELIVASRLQVMPGTTDGKTILVTNRDITESRRLEEALLAAIEEEQHRIGRDLHDGLGQELTAIGMLVSVAHKGLQSKGLPEAETLAKLGGMLKRTSSEVRRISHGLQPVAAEPGALMAALRQLVAEHAAVHGCQAEFHCPAPVEIADPGAANHLFRIAQEAVQNAQRHAKATRIVVRLQTHHGTLRLEIEDDGRGISKKRLNDSRGIGLSTMKHRANAMGGFLQVLRPRKGGTLIRCAVMQAQARPNDSKIERSQMGQRRMRIL